MLCHPLRTRLETLWVGASARTSLLNLPSSCQMLLPSWCLALMSCAGRLWRLVSPLIGSWPCMSACLLAGHACSWVTSSPLFADRFDAWLQADELAGLEAEANMPIEQLMAMYGCPKDEPVQPHRSSSGVSRRQTRASGGAAVETQAAGGAAVKAEGDAGPSTSEAERQTEQAAAAGVHVGNGPCGTLL